jgi:hypothetical protein
MKARTPSTWVSILTLLSTTRSIATETPKRLIGKTIHVSYTATRPYKLQEGGSSVGSKDVSYVIYISSAGRIFSRGSQSKGKRAQTWEAAPEVTLWHVVGGRLVATAARASGALMQTISFGSNFQSCDVTIIAGHENGKSYRWKGVNGDAYEADGPLSIFQQSCVIADGNGLWVNVLRRNGADVRSG